ncbi:MAG: hypothetical protein QM767_10835 [Anaeromyxobacter sp.]
MTLDFTCPGTTAASYSGTASCDANGVCSTVSGVGDVSAGDPAQFSTTCTKARFYGVLAYGHYPEKMFKTQDEAKAFDSSRYTDSAGFTSSACASAPGKSCSLVDTTRAKMTVSSATATCPSGRCYANTKDPGWFYEYGTVCPTGSCPDYGTCSPEKTGSGALVTFGCVLWNGFQPLGAQGGSDPCSGDTGTPLTYGYVSDYITGTPMASCGYTAASDTTLYRAQQRGALSPPSAPLLRITAGAGGGVRYGGLQMDPGGAPTNTTTGERSDFAEMVYWLEVPRELHSCRHDSETTSSSCK